MIRFEFDSQNFIGIDNEKLLAPKKVALNIHHLQSLGLSEIGMGFGKNLMNNENLAWGNEYRCQIKLTDFGKLFVKACIPEKGFETLKPEQ